MYDYTPVFLKLCKQIKYAELGREHLATPRPLDTEALAARHLAYGLTFYRSYVSVTQALDVLEKSYGRKESERLLAKTNSLIDQAMSVRGICRLIRTPSA